MTTTWHISMFVNAGILMYFCRYDYRLLVQYNIQCEDDQLAFFSVTDLDIQGAEECVDPMGHLKCVFLNNYNNYCNN